MSGAENKFKKVHGAKKADRFNETLGFDDLRRSILSERYFYGRSNNFSESLGTLFLIMPSFISIELKRF